jgi:hypothetical protein
MGDFWSHNEVEAIVADYFNMLDCCGLIKRTPQEETSKIKERGCSNDRPTEEKVHSGV